MIRFFLIILAILIVLSMLGYVIYLWVKLKKQKLIEEELKEQAEVARKERMTKIVDSIDVIARAMMVEQCALSEGILRLKPLLAALSKSLSVYSAMWELYEFVQEMPILDERKALKRNERMRQDLAREAKEAELDERIKVECVQLLNDLEEVKKAI